MILYKCPWALSLGASDFVNKLDEPQSPWPYMKDHLSRSRPPLTPHCDVAIPQMSYLEPIVFPGFCTTKRPLDRGAVLKEIRKHLATKGLCKQLPTQPWNPHTSLAVAGMRGRGRFVQVICGTLQEHEKNIRKET